MGFFYNEKNVEKHQNESLSEESNLTNFNGSTTLTALCFSSRDPKQHAESDSNLLRDAVVNIESLD